MARPLKLKVSKDSDSGKWRVNVPPRLSPGGKRERRFFDTVGAATAFVEQLKARRDNIAVVNRALSPTELLDAASALDLLAESSPAATLTEAVRGYLEVMATRSVSITLGELFEHFKTARQHRSKFYLRDIKWASDRFAPLHTCLVSDIRHTDLAAVLDTLPDSSRNNMLRTLRAVFRYGHDLGYLKEIPIRRNDFAPVKRTEVDVLPVGKIRQLLETALEHDPALLPLLLIETFCGVRPAEATRVQWSDLNFLRRRLTIRAAISKTATARPIEIAPCALAWFQAYAATPGLQTTGPIAPWPESILRSRLRKIRYLAGYRGAGAHWTPGSLRDAFCSYHLAHYGSIDRLITESGHTDLRTTKNHYLGLVSPEAAATFWNLYPHQEQKIIKLATA
jgi:integrase